MCMALRIQGTEDSTALEFSCCSSVLTESFAYHPLKHEAPKARDSSVYLLPMLDTLCIRKQWQNRYDYCLMDEGGWKIALHGQSIPCSPETVGRSVRDH